MTKRAAFTHFPVQRHEGVFIVLYCDGHGQGMRQTELGGILRSAEPRPHCPRWIRTTILGSKVRCPAIGRGGKTMLHSYLQGI